MESTKILRVLAAFNLAAALMLGACSDDGGDGGDQDATVDSAVTMDAGVNDDAAADAGADAAVATMNDNDIVLVRLTDTGAIDTTYGTNGVATINLGSVSDGVYGIGIHRDVANTDKVVIFGSRVNGTSTTDVARITARVQANGAGLDTTFAAQGIHSFNIASISDNARNGIVLADGTIVNAGYTGLPTNVGMMTANRVILIKLLPTGAYDTSFGAGGTSNINPFASQVPNVEHGFAEAYGVAVLANGNIVTTGYGRHVSTQTAVSQMNFVFSPNGSLNTGAWPGYTAPTYTMVPGTTVIQPNTAAEARGRNALALPGNVALFVGSANGANGTATTNRDIMFSVVDAAGSPTAIPVTGAGVTQTNGANIADISGGENFTDEACFGAALDPEGDFAVIAGYRAGTLATVAQDTDGVLGILNLTRNGGGDTTAVALTSLTATPASTTENDHFRAAAIYNPAVGDTRIYVAGFIGSPAVTMPVATPDTRRMLVGCFTPAGAACAGFGTNGFVEVDAARDAQGIVVDSMGRIIIAAPLTRQVPVVTP